MTYSTQIVPEPFVGYPAAVWQTCYQSLSWLNAEITGGVLLDNPIEATSAVLAVYQTLLNGIRAINASQTIVFLGNELTALHTIETLPLNLDPTTLSYLTARIAGITTMITNLTTVLPLVESFAVAPPNVLAAGSPAIPDIDLVTTYMQFVGEPPPSGLTAATLPLYANNAANAWVTMANAISQYNVVVPQAYDTAVREGNATELAATIVNACTSGPFVYSNTTVLWNNMVAAPAILTVANYLRCQPASLTSQQDMVIRFSLGCMSSQLAVLLLSLRQPVINNPKIVTVQTGQSLMDIANASTGNFENWQNIATANNLEPPWQLQVGTQLLIPPNGSSAVQNVTGIPAPNYYDNFLGIDWYVGPIGGDMPQWTGDVQTVAGYSNLQISLGRRLITTIGSLIYQPTFGSRIPPQVGQVQWSTTAGRIVAYAKAALLSDPRVAAVTQAGIVSGSSNFGNTQFIGTVVPAGPGLNPINVNQVIDPVL